jgi:hypothetical protein
VRYGPSVREVDAAVPVRQQVWSAMEVFLSVGKEATAWTREAKSAVVVESLLDGVTDPSLEVRIRVLGTTLTYALHQSGVVPSPSQWASITDRLIAILESAPPPQAVREERQAFEEGRQSAARAAHVCVEVMQASSTSPTTAGEEQLLTRLRAAVSATVPADS